MDIQDLVPDPTCLFCIEHNNIWSFLDGAIIISLKDRDDRYREASKEAHRVGLCQIAKFYRPLRDPNGFRKGCWDSTSKVCQYGLDQGFQNELSLEDDFEFDTRFTPEEIASRIHEAMEELPSKWYRLSLGHQSWLRFPYRAHITRAMSVLTHAQIWSRRGMEWMATHNYTCHRKMLESGVHVDGYISCNCPFSYSITPMIAFQRQLISDRDAKMEYMVMQPFCEATEWMNPLMWTVVLFLLLILITLVLYFCYRLPLSLAFIFPALFITIPFFIMAILVLTDTY